MSCHCQDPCYSCQESNPCGCVSKYSGECVLYDGVELTNAPCAVGSNFNEVIQCFDEYLTTYKDELLNFLQILNIGNGAELFAGITLTGANQFRTLVSGNDSLIITEGLEEIDFSVVPASETVAGAIEIATQTEVDAGTDGVKAVTPLTLLSSITTILSNPANLPDATETQKGVAEIATQAETDAGTDDERFITPLKLANYPFPPPTIPSATETVQGIAEIATQAETDAGTDDERFVTPLKLANYAPLQFVNKSVSLPYTLLPADNGAVLYTSGSGNITVPTGLGDEFECGIIQSSPGTVNVVGSGTTILVPMGLTDEIEGENFQAYVRSNPAVETFNLLGNLATV